MSWTLTPVQLTGFDLRSPFYRNERPQAFARILKDQTVTNTGATHAGPRSNGHVILTLSTGGGNATVLVERSEDASTWTRVTTVELSGTNDSEGVPIPRCRYIRASVTAIRGNAVVNGYAFSSGEPRQSVAEMINRSGGVDLEEQWLMAEFAMRVGPTPGLLPPVIPEPSRGAVVHSVSAGNKATFEADSWSAVTAGDIVLITDEITASGMVFAKSGTADSPIFIRGKDGLDSHISASGSNIALLVSANYVVVSSLGLASGGANNGANGTLKLTGSDIWVDNCRFHKSVNSHIRSGRDQSIKRHVIANCDIRNATVIGVRYEYNAAGGPYTMSAIQVWNCKFADNGTGHVRFQVETTGNEGSRINDTRIVGNVFSGGTLPITHNNRHSSTTAGGAADGVPRNKDLLIENNVGLDSEGMVIVGLTTSNAKFGKSTIKGNRFNNGTAVTGGLNLFFSSYVEIIGNQFNGHDSGVAIDGNGILIDNGNQYVRIWGNECSDNVGDGTQANKGAGIMILAASDVDARFNKLNGNGSGVYFGGSDVGVRLNFKFNRITDSVYYDIDMNSAVVDENAITWLGNTYGDVAVPNARVSESKFATHDLPI